jgi:hypothetical protein
MGNAVSVDPPAGAATSGLSIGGGPAGISTGAGGPLGPGGVAVPTPGRAQGADAYSLRGIYFKREWFESPADCLTAAYAKGLPLEVCQ